jgi:hypothetical protein
MKWRDALAELARERLPVALIGSALLWATEHLADKFAEYLLHCLLFLFRF